MKDRQRSISYAAIESSLFFGAALLSALLFLLFRLPYLIRTGLYGAGLLAAPLYLYMASLLISACLLPACVARLVAMRMERKHPADAVRLTRTLGLYITAGGAALTVFFWFLGPVFSRLCGNPFGSFSLRAVGPALWIMGYTGLLRGYYLGRGNSMLAALSVVLEQIFSAITALFLSSMFAEYGRKADLLYGETAYTAAYSAAGAVLSFAAGALLTLLVLQLLASASGGGMQEANEGRRLERLDSIHRSLERVLLPVLLGAGLVLFGPLMDLLVIGPRLSELYGAEEAVRLLGAFGTALLCFFVPVLAAGGIFAGLLPVLRYASSVRDRKLLSARMYLSAKFAAVFAVFCCALLAVIHEPLSNLLFSGEDTVLLRHLLLYGTPFLFFAVMALQKCAALCGLGYFTDPLKNAVWTFLAHLLLLVILIYAVKLEMLGVLLANLLSAALFWILNTANLTLRFRRRQGLWQTYLLPVLCAVPAFLAPFLLLRLCAAVLPEAVQTGRLVSGLLLFLCSLLLFWVYGAALSLSGALRRGELREMPLGHALERLLRRFMK